MPITQSSDENMRGSVLRYLEARKKERPGYSIIDVGGAANPWCDALVDAYVDIRPLKTQKLQFNGDINEPAVWERIPERRFDFSICTHTLEDIRDPAFVIQKLMRISRSGFISMPNKHTEMSNIESVYWLGYCHHRWVFAISGSGVLRILAKLPLTSYFSSVNRAPHILAGLNSGFLNSMLRKMRRAPVAGGLDWVDPRKVQPGYELGFIWEGSFPYEFVNGDFAGANVYEAAKLYTGQLAAGL